MTFKRKTELRFVKVELEQLKLLGMISRLMENQVNAARQNLDTLTLVAKLYESKNKTTKKSR